MQGSVRQGAKDLGLEPMALVYRAYCDRVRSGKYRTVTIAVRSPSAFQKIEFPVGERAGAETAYLADRLTKSLLWITGGSEILVTDAGIAGMLSTSYQGGARDFDRAFMEKVFGSFSVKAVSEAELKGAKGKASGTPAAGWSQTWTRTIGLDLGGTARKVCAMDGDRVVFSETVPWSPSAQSSPDYFLQEVRRGVAAAKKALPKAQAVGISTAGIVLFDRLVESSLFLGLSSEAKRNLAGFAFDLSAEFGIPVSIFNDGDAATLAGAKDGEACVLGTSLGTSQAGGYLGKEGVPEGWFNELAFVPVDAAPDAQRVLWGEDVGCGEQYLSQWGLIRLAGKRGIRLVSERGSDGSDGFVGTDLPSLMAQFRALPVEVQRTLYEDLGRVLGYAALWYAEFYEIRKLVFCGGITTGINGRWIQDAANDVLQQEGASFSVEAVTGEAGGLQQCFAAARFAKYGRKAGR